eukprot:CAMPEP_0119487800 /NCGR_PEP_ID=MMETSP1344-20130328/13765_1 /TAXON_ID=236787 /ORGANISM="Florenciella parvula, Strain CCMP2471" /LENGTH=406 /DNA_ID=CAMNT_0007522687 /DNA_START=102 /DNA_END=1324 /DNA_ORIENTATION=+
MLPQVVAWLRRHAIGLGTIWIVSDSPNVIEPDLMTKYGVVWVAESVFKFRKEGLPRSDIYQQLLKLFFLDAVPAARRHVLVCDADVLWLRDVEFVDSDGRALYAWGAESYWDIADRAHGGFGYPDFVSNLLGYGKPHPNRTAVAHHMVFERTTVNDLVEYVAARFGPNGNGHPVARMPPEVALTGEWEPWMVFVQAFHTFALPRPSEYDLYYSFVTATATATSMAADRELVWSDFGACCRDGPGLSLEVSVGAEVGAEVAVGAEVGVAGVSGRPTCNSEDMHDGLGAHFDYIACHRHMRDRNDRMENGRGSGQGTWGRSTELDLQVLSQVAGRRSQVAGRRSQVADRRSQVAVTAADADRRGMGAWGMDGGELGGELAAYSPEFPWSSEYVCFVSSCVVGANGRWW